MIRPLDGARSKIDRAREHLEALNREWLGFFKLRSNPVSFNHSFDGTWYVISVSPPLKEPPPLRLSVICGDVVHNLRSALDHLIWQLVLAEGNSPGQHNAFPIYTDSRSFDKRVRSPEDHNRSPLHGIDPEGEPWTFIENLQPYRSQKLLMDPRSHQLALLAALSNTDKHRTLHAQMLFPEEDSVRSAVEWNPDAILVEGKFIAIQKPLSLEHETEVARLRFSDKGPDPQVRVNSTPRLVPTFGNKKRQVSIGLLGKEIFSYVSTTIEYSRRFFV